MSHAGCWLFALFLTFLPGEVLRQYSSGTLVAQASTEGAHEGTHNTTRGPLWLDFSTTSYGDWGVRLVGTPSLQKFAAGGCDIGLKGEPDHGRPVEVSVRSAVQGSCRVLFQVRPALEAGGLSDICRSSSSTRWGRLVENTLTAFPRGRRQRQGQTASLAETARTRQEWTAGAEGWSGPVWEGQGRRGLDIDLDRLHEAGPHGADAIPAGPAGGGAKHGWSGEAPADGPGHPQLAFVEQGGVAGGGQDGPRGAYGDEPPPCHEAAPQACCAAKPCTEGAPGHSKKSGHFCAGMVLLPGPADTAASEAGPAKGGVSCGLGCLRSWLARAAGDCYAGDPTADQCYILGPIHRRLLRGGTAGHGGRGGGRCCRRRLPTGGHRAKQAQGGEPDHGATVCHSRIGSAGAAVSGEDASATQVRGQGAGGQEGRDGARCQGRCDAPWQGPVICQQDVTGPITAPIPAFTSVMVEHNYVSRWMAPLLALCLQFEVGATAAYAQLPNIFEVDDPRLAACSDDLGGTTNIGEAAKPAPLASVDAGVFQSSRSWVGFPHGRTTDVASGSGHNENGHASLPPVDAGSEHAPCTVSVPREVQFLKRGSLHRVPHAVPLRVAFADRPDGCASNAWGRQLNRVAAGCPAGASSLCCVRNPFPSPDCSSLLHSTPVAACAACCWHGIVPCPPTLPPR